MKGDIYPSESQVIIDEKTGVSIRRVTTHPSIHHHPFYYLPAYDMAMRWLVFISHRTGTPQIFVEDRQSQQLIQLTDRPDLSEWSIHPSHDGKYVYFTTEQGAWRVDCETQLEEELVHFGGDDIREPGMVGAAMGTTSVSHDDRWWAVPIKAKDVASLFVINTNTGDHDVILQRDTIGHPQFHPDDAQLLRYAGPYDQRLWVINRDGSDNRLVYKREESIKQWIVHETWMPGRRELLATDWPHGVVGIDIDTGKVRQVCGFNAWHPMVNRQGTLMVTDTTYPDVGLHLFDPQCRVNSNGNGTGNSNANDQTTLLCESRATNIGAHWNSDHCPYDDGPVDVFSPQHTHPHPNFSPDGSRVVFTSDRTGVAQIYEVEVSH